LRFKTIIAILAVKAVLTENHEPVAGSPHTARPPPASKHASAISAALLPYCRAARSSRSTVWCFPLIPAAHAQNTRCLCRARVRQRGAGNATLRLRSCNPRCGTGTSGSESVGEDMNALPWSAVQASRSTSTRCRSLSPSNDDGYLVHEDGWPRRLSPRSAPPGARHERSNAHLGGACSRSSYETLMRMYAAVRDSPAAMVVLYREHEAGSEAAREPPTLRVIMWSSSKQHAGVVAVV